VKKFTSLAVASLIALLSSVAMAEQKIAVVDVYRAIMASESAKAAVAELKNEFKPEQNQLQSLEKEIKALQDKGQKEGMLMTEDDKRRLFEEIQSKKSDYKHIVQKVQKMQAAREKAFLAENKPAVDAAMKALVDELKLDLLLTRESTIWVSPDMDVTLKLLEKLNKAPAAQ
jgi:outer membrane protein